MLSKIYKTVELIGQQSLYYLIISPRQLLGYYTKCNEIKSNERENNNYLKQNLCRYSLGSTFQTPFL